MAAHKYKILLIEDEKHISHLVCALLETNGYQVISAKDNASGQMLFFSHMPDLVVLDLGLPDGDGMEFLRSIRKQFNVPVIVLSARSDEKDKVMALDCGANDYITKPFGSAELVARVRSALRIQHYYAKRAQNAGIFQSGGLKTDYDARRVWIDGEEVKLTQTEYNILSLLSMQAGKVLTYTAIIKAIWGYNDLGSTKKLQVNMANIRKKLGEKPGKKNYIVNELGVGYRMNEENI